MSAILALGVVAALWAEPPAEPDRPPGFRLSDLSGTWVGTHTVEQVGQCRGPGESAVILTLDVSDDGRIEVQQGGGTLGTGTVFAETWRLTLQQDTFARCGDDERRYRRERTGVIRRENDDFVLELEGEDAPCPPRCVFNDRYRVTKRELEELLRRPAGQGTARATPRKAAPDAAPPDVSARTAPDPLDLDDQVRKAAVLRAIEEESTRKRPNDRFAPVAYCIAVDGARDHGDPEPPSASTRANDADLFMQGPREEPSAALLNSLRDVQPLAVAWSECPEFAGRRTDWWSAPIHVFVRRLFRLEDGSVKVPVMKTRPNSGCHDFVYYHVRGTEGRWTVTAPDIRHSLCY